jgi:hypothetical protein
MTDLSAAGTQAARPGRLVLSSTTVQPTPPRRSPKPPRTVLRHASNEGKIGGRPDSLPCARCAEVLVLPDGDSQHDPLTSTPGRAAQRRSRYGRRSLRVQSDTRDGVVGQHALTLATNLGSGPSVSDRKVASAHSRSAPSRRCAMAATVVEPRRSSYQRRGWRCRGADPGPLPRPLKRNPSGMEGHGCNPVAQHARCGSSALVS